MGINEEEMDKPVLFMGGRFLRELGVYDAYLPKSSARELRSKEGMGAILSVSAMSRVLITSSNGVSRASEGDELTSRRNGLRDRSKRRSNPKSSKVLG